MLRCNLDAAGAEQQVSRADCVDRGFVVGDDVVVGCCDHLDAFGDHLVDARAHRNDRVGRAERVYVQIGSEPVRRLDDVAQGRVARWRWPRQRP